MYSSSQNFIDNKKINNFLQNINNSHRAPHNGKFRPKVKFLKQVNTNPIILKAFGTRLKGIQKEYKNYLIKKFLNQFKIVNKVAIIKFINNENPFS